MIDDENSSQDNNLNLFTMLLIVGGGVCCCLIIAIGVCLFIKYRDKNDGSYCKYIVFCLIINENLINSLFLKKTASSEFQTANNNNNDMCELNEMNDYATQSLPRVDTYQSSANTESQ